MDKPALQETLDNIRRLAERGLDSALASPHASLERATDSFQAILDEVEVAKVYIDG